MQPAAPPDPMRSLAAHVPRRFWEDLKQSKRQMYAEAHAHMNRMHPRLATNYRGHHLLQFGQQVFLDTARKYGLTVDVVETDSPGYFYTIVRAGLYVFTDHYSSTPGALIRPAGYKKTLAGDPQLFVEPGQIAGADKFYGAVLHYPSFVYTPTPRVEFKGLTVGFPDRRCTRYVSLFDPLSAYQLDSVSVSESEYVADSAKPKLLRQVKSSNSDNS